MDTKLCITVAVALLLMACGSAQPPPDNSQNNDLTMRQQLIELFQTAEVVPVPTQNHQYLIRDSNGAIWFTRTDGTTEAGTVMLMAGRSNRWALPPFLRSTNTLHLGSTNKTLILEDVK